MALQFPQEKNIEAWQVFIWNLPDDFLSRPQKFQFMLMLEGQFNEFDPFPVVRDLLQNRHLWNGVVMDRGYTGSSQQFPDRLEIITDLIKLRDIKGCWNVDTVFILASTTHLPALQKLAETWQADEISVLSGSESDNLLGIGRHDHPDQIIAVWWD